jgi:thiol:disulfide interchange protein
MIHRRWAERRLWCVVFAVVCAAGIGCGDTPDGTAVAPPHGLPPAARTVVDDAVRRARADGKIVLIEFGASWCKWCTNFQNFVDSKEVGHLVAANYVVANLVVREDDDKKALEHPGGGELMEEWGGGASGLPFYVFLDVDGRKLVDSNVMPGGANIGFPVSPEEIDAFMGLLDRTAPRLGDADRARIVEYLRSPKPS